MASNGRVVVDGITYVDDRLFRAIAEQNLEMGITQQRLYALLNELGARVTQAEADANQARQQALEAIQARDDAIAKVIALHHRLNQEIL